MRLWTIGFMGLALAMTACGSAYDTELPTDMNDQNAMTSFQEKIAQLPDEDQSDVRSYMLRMSMGAALGGVFGTPKTDGIPRGMTVRKAIDEQRVFKANRKKEAPERKAGKKAE